MYNYYRKKHNTPQNHHKFTKTFHLQGLQLKHLIIMIHHVQGFQIGNRWYIFNLAKTQATITTQTKYYT